MRRFRTLFSAVIAAFAMAFAPGSPASAAEVRVMTSGTLAAVIEDFKPDYEKVTGNRLIIILDPPKGAHRIRFPRG